MADAPKNPSSSKSEAVTAAVVAAGGSELPLTQDGIQAVQVERDIWHSFARALRDDENLSYEMLISLTAVDHYDAEMRYEVVAHAWSLRHNHMLRIKIPVPESALSCPSVVDIWPTADWLEREVFDMFGIEFDRHPDLRRILMPDDYPYFPLRKDFPLQGIDNSVSYRNEGGTLMTPTLDVDRPAGLDETPVDLSHGDPEGYTDGAEAS